jgi:branched-chain amino acid transport system ATP-binding protein
MSGPAIEAQAVVKEFGGLRAVDGVTLRVPVGERRALIGPNGAGKTTLFHCIAGTLRPTSGRIALFGSDVTRLPEHRRTALGMTRTFQISNVFADLSAAENLLLALLGTDRRKWVIHRSAAAFVDEHERARRALDTVGLDARGAEPVRSLSYGERRQLELAIALVARPRALMLDEPCAGLSPSERARVVRIIAELPRDITILMIEHDMDVALGLADHVTVLHRGRTVCEGPPEAVRADAQVREIYFGHA